MLNHHFYLNVNNDYVYKNNCIILQKNYLPKYFVILSDDKISCKLKEYKLLDDEYTIPIIIIKWFCNDKYFKINSLCFLIISYCKTFKYQIII